MDKTIWKDIPGYDGNYLISKDGRIFSNISNKELTPYIEKSGYVKVSLLKDGRYISYRVHRLVMITYVDNPDSLPEINHKNGIKNDNRIENLEWCTKKHNLDHSLSSGLTVEGKRIIRTDINGINPIVYESIHEATRDLYPEIKDSYKINSLTKGIRRNLKQEIKSHKGYIFKFL